MGGLPRRYTRCWSVLLLGAASALTTTPVLAEPTPEDRTLAETLFLEGQKLADAGKYAEACPKFTESQRLDPAPGTLLNLAVCHEGQGKIATAWSEFHMAADWARRTGRADRERFALQHAASLEPQLPRVTIRVAPETAKQAPEVRLDDTVVNRAAWDVATPVDPGSHQIRVTASGKRPWQTNVELVARGAAVTVKVEPLQDEGQAATAAAPQPSRPERAVDTGQTALTAKPVSPRLGVLLGEGAVALGGLVVGLVYELKASSAQTQVDDFHSRLVQSQIPYPCKAPGVGAGPDCAALVSSVDERIRDHNIALAGFVGAGLGAAALAATAYLWKPSPGGDKSPAMTPIVTRQATGLVLTWRH